MNSKSISLKDAIAIARALQKISTRLGDDDRDGILAGVGLVLVNEARERERLRKRVEVLEFECRSLTGACNIRTDELHRLDGLSDMAECAAIMAFCGYFSRMRGPDFYWNPDDDTFCYAKDAGIMALKTPLYAGSAPVPAEQMDNPNVMTRATAYARDIVTWLHRDHYADNTRFEPFDDLLGLLSQIDNMVCGWKELSVAAICNAYESGVGHRGRPTANVNPYREGTPEHEAYAIGAKGEAAQAEAKVSVGDSRFESWFAQYNPSGKGDKQRARDAYAAGMSDPAEAKAADEVAETEWADTVRELIAVASYRPACQKYGLDRCRCFECVSERAVGLLSRNAAMLATKAKGE